jgi:hypothetical protein
MDFYLGTHQPHWLARYDVPLMVSRRTLTRMASRPRAICPWFRDSGGFTQLQLHGSWDGVPVEQFVKETRRDAVEVGQMAYCAPQDWMCEPIIISGGKIGPLVFVGTGLSVAEHQRRTVTNYLDLMQRAPDLPWAPVLQGWTLDDYLRCFELYDRAGVDLSALPRVGVGSICRRQGTEEAATILARLNAEGLKLHAFGLKGTGIPNVAPFLASSDSLAWSYAARRAPPLAECERERARTGRGHKNCANCWRYARQWLAEIEADIRAHQVRPYQTCFAL